jgi:hypothetical protein
MRKDAVKQRLARARARLREANRGHRQCIGELSPFHETFGYYAHGVAEETALLPQGWKDRLVAVQNANPRLETVDLDPTIRERVRSRVGRAFGG